MLWFWRLERCRKDALLILPLELRCIGVLFVKICAELALFKQEKSVVERHAVRKRPTDTICVV